MNTKVNEIVDAILRNNPHAVSANLSQLGIFNGISYDPGLLKQIIIEQIAYMREEEGFSFVTNVLDVPIDPYGAEASYLQNLSFEQEISETEKGSGFFNDYIRKNEKLVTAAIITFIIFLFVGIIYLIRKL